MTRARDVYLFLEKTALECDADGDPLREVIDEHVIDIFWHAMTDEERANLLRRTNADIDRIVAGGAS